MTFLWSPYDRPPMRVRRNPQASLYYPEQDRTAWPWDDMLTPNGIATLGEASDTAASAMAMLNKAGTRGLTAIGAAAGFLLSEQRLRGTIIGGVLGYLGGRFVVGMASKVVSAVNAVGKIEKVVS